MNRVDHGHEVVVLGLFREASHGDPLGFTHWQREAGVDMTIGHWFDPWNQVRSLDHLEILNETCRPQGLPASLRLPIQPFRL